VLFFYAMRSTFEVCWAWDEVTKASLWKGTTELKMCIVSIIQVCQSAIYGSRLNKVEMKNFFYQDLSRWNEKESRL